MSQAASIPTDPTLATQVREQRGLVIAATCRLTKKGGVWIVPSQTGKGKYTVCPDPTDPHCTCPDHETRGGKCKHIFAVEIVRKREQNADGSTTVTESVTVVERKTYPQDWPAYNAAQTNEKSKFQMLLHDLCDGIPPPARNMGRPRLPMGDAAFAVCFKIYSTFSGRGFISDLREAHSHGYISKVPHFNSIFNYLDDADFTPILNKLITESSLPLRTVELDFAADSSGFTTSRFIRWFDHKYGGERRQHEWVKVHLMCGVKTNIVTAVEIRGRDANESPLMPNLVNKTAENFTMREVSGDKQFGSLGNYAAIDAVGAT